MFSIRFCLSHTSLHFHSLPLFGSQANSEKIKRFKQSSQAAECRGQQAVWKWLCITCHQKICSILGVVVISLKTSSSISFKLILLCCNVRDTCLHTTDRTNGGRHFTDCNWAELEIWTFVNKNILIRPIHYSNKKKLTVVLLIKGLLPYCHYSFFNYSLIVYLRDADGLIFMVSHWINGSVNGFIQGL